MVTRSRAGLHDRGGGGRCRAHHPRGGRREARSPGGRPSAPPLSLVASSTSGRRRRSSTSSTATSGTRRRADGRPFRGGLRPAHRGPPLHRHRQRHERPLRLARRLDVAPGDEVILPPYTFVATLNVVFLQYALPVFVDSDPRHSRWTPANSSRDHRADGRHRSGAPRGNACDLDAILEIAGRRKLPVLEDACQAHLGEWRGRKLGTLGAAGCFSFQASKNLTRRGGAILTSDDALAERCWASTTTPLARGRPAPPSAAAAPTSASRNSRRGSCSPDDPLESSRGPATRSAYSRSSSVRSPASCRSGCTRAAPAMPGTSTCSATRPSGSRGFARAVPEGARGRGSVLGRLHAARQAASCGPPSVARLPTPLPKAVLADWEERNRCPANDRLCDEAVGSPRPCSSVQGRTWTTSPLRSGRSRLPPSCQGVRGRPW